MACWSEPICSICSFFNTLQGLEFIFRVLQKVVFPECNFRSCWSNAKEQSFVFSECIAVRRALQTDISATLV